MKLAWPRRGPRFPSAMVTETPFQKAGQIWDQRMGSAVTQMRAWRLATFVALGLATGLTGGLIHMALRSRLVPFVIEVDPLGATRPVGPLREGYEPTDAQIAYALGQLIRQIRSLPLDPIILRQNWLEAYGHLTSRGAAQLNDWAAHNDPFAMVGRRTVTVELTSAVRASPRSFELRWKETTYENGARVDEARFTGIATFERREAADSRTLRRNPLGLYVDALHWSRDLAPGERP